MKNIHILPTDKPSRLYHWKGNNTYNSQFRLRPIAGFCDFNQNDAVNQHIYITSDEEIKEGDWFLDDNNQISHSYRLSHVKFANPKKIILTTDQYLIKDGVQAINDEFLEFFVKNPNCECVEVQKFNGFAEDYLISIPKEEPKFENLIDNTMNIMSIANSMFGKKEEPKQETLEYDLLQQIKFCLECKNDSQAIRLIEKYGFEKQEKCEKDLDAHLDVAEHLWLQAVKENKKMYSEEEVKKQLNLILAMKNSLLDTFTDDEGFITDKWFKQFKNK